MNHRSVKPIPAERVPFGLVAWLEQTKITLPLRGVECQFNVCGEVVSVELDQIFHQNSGQPLDCLYTFPLPASAAVYRCQMHVNGRVISARVEEREQARKLAREKKAAGHRTALVEMERDNLFTLSLGNVQPGDIIVVRLAYFQVLTRLGDWTSFSVPFCPGVRYVPGTPLLRTNQGRGTVDDTDQAPDASRISPPRIDRLHPDAAYLCVAGTVEHPLGELKDLSSPSHPVIVKSQLSCSSVAIADRGAAPDADFILRWTEIEPEGVRSAGWVVSHETEAFALIRLRAPAQVAAPTSYAQDLYFLIDRSGSMQGLKWQKAVEAFRAFLGGLGEQDRVWATFFESRYRDLAEKPLPARELASDAGVQSLEALGTGGGTELFPALAHVLKKIETHSTGRPVSLLLITDGQVANERAILQQLAGHAELRVHVFGIDIAINDGFLQKLAAQHHGSACLLSPQDDIVGAVKRLGERLGRPVLTAIRTPEGWELAGQEMPDLHADEVLSLPLRARGKSPRPERAVSLEAMRPDGQPARYSFDLAKTESPAVRLLWAKRRIDFLLAQGQAKEAIALAKECNLVCDGTAFVAWDETEKVPVSAPDREVYQPAMQIRSLMANRPVGRVCRAQAMPSMDEDAARYFCAGSPAPGDHFQERQVILGNAYSTPCDSDEPELQRWRGEIAKDVIFQNPAGLQFLDVLVAWAGSMPNETGRRLRRLEELLISLRRAAGQPVQERRKLVREWIARRLEGEDQPRVLEAFQRWEAEAQQLSSF